MMEIVFDDSACGDLKIAQHYGQGEYHSGCIGVILRSEDGSQPTQEQIEAAQRDAEEEMRLEWEEATPMGGNPQDVFGFQLLLSMGDIQADDFLNKRQTVIDTLWNIFPNAPSDGSFRLSPELSETLDTVLERAAHGEDIRIWYSNKPDDLCGLYWFMAELKPFEKQLGTVFVVKLPEYEYFDNSVKNHSSWGDIFPGEWHRYTKLAETTTSVFRRHCASLWQDLQAENAPLRATLNGKLFSVPETIYDDFILREIAKESDEFHEARLIGRVLGKYQLGIGDAWIAHRIEKMIEDGSLISASDPPPDSPIYHRYLKKNPRG